MEVPPRDSPQQPPKPEDKKVEPAPQPQPAPQVLRSVHPTGEPANPTPAENPLQLAPQVLRSVHPTAPVDLATQVAAQLLNPPPGMGFDVIIESLDGHQNDPAVGLAFFDALDGPHFSDNTQRIGAALKGSERGLRIFDTLLAAATRDPGWEKLNDGNNNMWFAGRYSSGEIDPALLSHGLFSDAFLEALGDACLVRAPDATGDPGRPPNNPPGVRAILEAMARNPNFAYGYLLRPIGVVGRARVGWLLLYFAYDATLAESIGHLIRAAASTSNEIWKLLRVIGEGGAPWPDSLCPLVADLVASHIADFIGQPQVWMANVFSIAMLNQDANGDEGRCRQIRDAVKSWIGEQVHALEGGATLGSLLDFQVSVGNWGEESGKLFALYSTALLHSYAAHRQAASWWSGTIINIVSAVLSTAAAPLLKNPLVGLPVGFVENELFGMIQSHFDDAWFQEADGKARKLDARDFALAARAVVGVVYAKNPGSLPESLLRDRSEIDRYVGQLIDQPSIIGALGVLRDHGATPLHALQGVMLYEAVRDMKSRLDDAFSVWNAQL